MPETIKLTPSPEAYRKTLRLIIECSTKPEDRVWAREEYERIKDVTEWSTDASE